MPSPGHVVTALVHGVRLAPGVTLIVDGASRTPSNDDVAAVLEAARPLLTMLTALGLTGPNTPSPASSGPLGDAGGDARQDGQSDHPDHHTEGMTP